MIVFIINLKFTHDNKEEIYIPVRVISNISKVLKTDTIFDELYFILHVIIKPLASL